MNNITILNQYGGAVLESGVTPDKFFANVTGFKNHVNYAFDCDDGKTYGYKGACHAGMGSIRAWTKGKVVRWYSQLRKGDVSQELADEFWDAILDPSVSPWRSVINGLEFVYNKAGERIAFSVIIDENTNNQVLTNLGMASRQTYEHPENWNTYLALRESKRLTPIQCALGSMLFYRPYGSGQFIPAYNFGHHPFNEAVNVNLGALLKGTPRFDKSKTVASGAVYYPCNAIWDGSKEIALESLFSKYKEERVDTGIVNSLKFKKLYTVYTKAKKNEPKNTLSTEGLIKLIEKEFIFE